MHSDIGFVTFKAMPRQSLGLCAYFDATELTCTSKEKIDAIRKQSLAVSIAQIHYTGNTSLGKFADPDRGVILKDRLAEVNNEYQALIQSTKETGQNGQFTLFNTHRGRCAFDIDFDTAASVLAFARQGKIVEIVHGADGLRPDIRVTAPTTPIRRNIRPNKPQLRAQ